VRDAEKVRTNKAVYRAAHREEIATYNRVYSVAHREERNARDRVLYVTNPDKKRARNRAYYSACCERLNARDRVRRIRVCGEQLNLDTLPPQVRELGLLLKQARRVIQESTKGALT
jgi:hypothetical protein